MRWLIDGYNVIRRDPDLRGAEERGLESGRRALLALVAGAARRSTDRFTVVFDGAPGGAPTGSHGQVETLFSRPPQKADDVLARLAREGREGAVVVTSDRTVADAARRAGCPVVGAEAFVVALSGGGDDDDADDDDEDDRPATRGGNPRRRSREERAARRALDRLRRG
ncbi:MAG: NYN domain-containing protein [Candidatus Rokubacteria bacterium]|nr:NYN domain-containing protein [Candidatus Rokubacteria bacterium]